MTNEPLFNAEQMAFIGNFVAKYINLIDEEIEKGTLDDNLVESRANYMYYLAKQTLKSEIMNYLINTKQTIK